MICHSFFIEMVSFSKGAVGETTYFSRVMILSARNCNATNRSIVQTDRQTPKCVCVVGRVGRSIGGECMLCTVYCTGTVDGGREGGVGGMGAPYDKDYLDRPSFQGAAYDR